MITLELNETVYKVPSEWCDITIGQLQSLVKIEPSLDEIDKTVQTLNILSGIPTESLLDLPYTEYAKLLNAIGFIQSQVPDQLLQIFEHDGVKYEFQCELTSMTTAEYIDLDSLTANSNPDNLHILMAIMYRPKGCKYNSNEVRERSLIFQQHMPISCAIGAQAFMEVLGQMLSTHTPVSSQPVQNK